MSRPKNHCPVEKMSLRNNVPSKKCPVEKVSVEKVSVEKMSVEKMSRCRRFHISVHQYIYLPFTQSPYWSCLHTIF